MKIGNNGIVSYAGLSKRGAALRRRIPASAGRNPRAVPTADFAVSRGADTKHGVRRQGDGGNKGSFRPAASASIRRNIIKKWFCRSIPRTCIRGIIITGISITKATIRARACSRWTTRGRRCFPSTARFWAKSWCCTLSAAAARLSRCRESLKIRTGLLDAWMEEHAGDHARVRSRSCGLPPPPSAPARRTTRTTCAAEYLKSTDREAVSVSQRELELLLQRRAMIGPAKRATRTAARCFICARRGRRNRSASMRPMRYACDLFTEQAVTPASARLAQPYYEGREVIGDLWIPYAGYSAIPQHRRDGAAYARAVRKLSDRARNMILKPAAANTPTTSALRWSGTGR